MEQTPKPADNFYLPEQEEAIAGGSQALKIVF